MPTSSGVLNSELVCAEGADLARHLFPALAFTSPLVCFTLPPLPTYIYYLSPRHTQLSFRNCYVKPCSFERHQRRRAGVARCLHSCEANSLASSWGRYCKTGAYQLVQFRLCSFYQI